MRLDGKKWSNRGLGRIGIWAELGSEILKKTVWFPRRGSLSFEKRGALLANLHLATYNPIGQVCVYHWPRLPRPIPNTTSDASPNCCQSTLITGRTQVRVGRRRTSDGPTQVSRDGQAPSRRREVIEGDENIPRPNFRGERLASDSQSSPQRGRRTHINEKAGAWARQLYWVLLGESGMYEGTDTGMHKGCS